MKGADYIPVSKLQDYWTRDRVLEVVHATDCQILEINIRNHYLQTISILAWISKSGQPYIHYLKLFNQHKIGDDSLPLQGRPEFLPSSNDADDFWAVFHELQWTFCPVALGPSKLHDRRIYHKQILPLRIMDKPLGHVKDGKLVKVKLAKLQSPTELNLSTNVGHHSMKSPLSLYDYC